MRFFKSYPHVCALPGWSIEAQCVREEVYSCDLLHALALVHGLCLELSGISGI